MEVQLEYPPSDGAVIGAITCVADILLTKDFGFSNPKWKCPGGGIELGESPLAALGRELKEEIDLDLNISWMYGIPVVGRRDIIVTNIDTRMLPSSSYKFLYRVEVPPWEMSRMNNTVRLGQDAERILCRRFKLALVKEMHGFLAQQLVFIQQLLHPLAVRPAA